MLISTNLAPSENLSGGDKKEKQNTFKERQMPQKNLGLVQYTFNHKE
jgi:hypothetical protein